tara:strand:- start:688 stop:894 length:207 start_codon:yes stop_codon:yes gene_type:complete
MSDFLERLAGVIHWLGFLFSGYLAYLIFFSEGTSTNPLWMNIAIVVAPNALGWLIKFIFTGNSKFLPF